MNIRPRELRVQVVAVEDVVAEHEATRLAADELAADDEGLGQSLGRGCTAYANRSPQLRAVAQQPLEARHVLRASR